MGYTKKFQNYPNNNYSPFGGIRGSKMKFTKLQIEIINDRTELPCAMSEVLADEFGIGFNLAEDIVDENLPNLIKKLEAEKPLNMYEASLALDIATNRTYPDQANDAIGDNFPSPTDPIMTTQRANAIYASHENMVNKIERVLNQPKPCGT